MDSSLKDKINATMELWKRFWGDQLKSAYLFGSAARGQWSPKSSDINILLLVGSHDYKRWPEAADIARRKAKKGFALPLVLTENYIRSSLDVFPIEFLDIQLFHDVLHGEDIFPGLTIEKEHLRLQAEREVKGKWVQLRQAALDRGGNTVAMRDLLAMSVPTWVSVFQAMLVIEGTEVPADKREVLRIGAEHCGVEPNVFLSLETVRREQKAMNRAAAWDLLQGSLEQVDHLARFVDSWDTNRG